jgi:hypothetical protein
MYVVQDSGFSFSSASFLFCLLDRIDRQGNPKATVCMQLDELPGRVTRKQEAELHPIHPSVYPYIHAYAHIHTYIHTYIRAYTSRVIGLKGSICLSVCVCKNKKNKEPRAVWVENNSCETFLGKGVECLAMWARRMAGGCKLFINFRHMCMHGWMYVYVCVRMYLYVYERISDIIKEAELGWVWTCIVSKGHVQQTSVGRPIQLLYMWSEPEERSPMACQSCIHTLKGY